MRACRQAIFQKQGLLKLSQKKTERTSRLTRLFNVRRNNKTVRKENLPEKIVKAASDTSGSEQQWEFLHCVKPREERDPTRRDSNNMPFASYYI